ncbi:MAG: hypothetical protein EPO07_10540 [Verrucomicrobia bacterium]|nr:MAG: hypothetical protein EPO07_10540 [Verrucomicrobiota bacterium]
MLGGNKHSSYSNIDEKQMIPIAKKPAWPLASALMLFFAATHGVLGQEMKFTNYNCAITSPDGWQMMTNLPSQPGLLAAFGKTDKTALIILMVDDRNKPSGPLDDRFVSEFERGVQSNGVGERISGRFFEVAGIKCYERLGTALVKGKHASTITQVVPADGRFYHLNAMRFDGDANEDPEIRKGLASFRFIRAPAIPVRSYSSGSPAYQTGYSIGKMSGVAVTVVVAIVIVRSILRQRNKRKPSVPPPLPPSR